MISHKNDSRAINFVFVTLMAVMVVVIMFVLCINVKASESNKNSLGGSIDNYLEFYSENGFKLNLDYLLTDGIVQVSSDAMDWDPYTKGTYTSAAQSADNNYHVYLYIAAATYARGTVIEGKGGILFADTSGAEDSGNLAVNCTGSISALVNNTPGNDCFWMLFNGSKSLVSPPDMSGLINIGPGGCGNMFYGCVSLTSPPDLTAVESIGDNGCKNMFNDCTSLTSPPDLSAVKTIGESGCEYMFNNCPISLPPDLSAVETIGKNGCYYMFHNCISLASAPDMSSVKTIGEYGCSCMFNHCTYMTTSTDMSSLKSIDDSGCHHMFLDCTFLASGPNMPALETVGISGCEYMFQDCKTLKCPINLPSLNNADKYALRYMYCGCIDLECCETPTTKLIKGWKMFDPANAGEDWNKEMFQDCAGPFTGTPLPGTTYYVMYPDTQGYNNIMRVVQQIEALPLPENITSNDRDVVMAARAGFNALTIEQQNMLINAFPATYQKLLDCEVNINNMKEQADVECFYIDNAPSTGDVTQNLILILSCFVIVVLAFSSIRRQCSLTKNK